MAGFELGRPAIVCRWRMAERRLPLENRHLRALGARRLGEERLSKALVAWAKQHIEWTLDEAAQSCPDGVLMLVVDEEGRSAMSLGPYTPLARTTANDLLARAQSSRREAQRTGVSPEDLWVARGDTLVWATTSDFVASGASTLVADLARTMGMPVVRDEELLARASTQGMGTDEVFLVSDEHGVVVASDRGGRRSQKFAAGYAKLLSTYRGKK